jgi:adenylylsulfate kinase
MYAKARLGEIKEFTGISSPYEEPLKPELVVDTGKDSLEDCAQQVLDFMEERGIFTLVDLME